MDFALVSHNLTFSVSIKMTIWICNDIPPLIHVIGNVMCIFHVYVFLQIYATVLYACIFNSYKWIVLLIWFCSYFLQQRVCPSNQFIFLLSCIIYNGGIWYILPIPCLSDDLPGCLQLPDSTSHAAMNLLVHILF